MKKENIYLDLSKLSVEEIKEIPNILKKGNQELYFLAEKTIESGKLDNYYKHLVFAKATINIWVFSHYKPKRIEIDLSEFRQLFSKGEEVLQVENYISIEELTKLCNDYNRNTLKITNLERDLEYKRSWSKESIAIKEIHKEVSHAQAIKENTKSKLQEIGIVF